MSASMRSLVLCAVVLAAAAAAAQAPRTSETIEVSIVNVDVVVTDGNGNRVTGLTAKDFEIRDGGKLQPITNFTEYRPATPAAAEGAPSAPPEPRAPRTVVLFIEPTRLPPAEAKEIFDAMRALVRDTIGENDRAMVVSWDRRGDRSIVRQPFTSDRTAVETVLGELELEHRRGRPDHAEGFLREQHEALIEAERLEDTGSEWMEETLGADAYLNALRQLRSIQRKAGALQALMSSISAFEGRKVLVLSMRRFGAYAGAEYFPGAQVAEERARELHTDKIHQALIRMANANNVVLYPVYPSGMDSPGISARVSGSASSAEGAPGAGRDLGVMQNELASLQNLAVRTGGVATWGAAQIAGMLPRVADDLESYYSLGYRAAAQRKDVARAIAVRTRDPQYRVRTRAQVVEKSDATLMRERLMANLHGHLESKTIPIAVQFGAPAPMKGRKRWRLPLRIHFPMEALTFLPAGRNQAAAFSVLVMVDTMASADEAHHQTQPLAIPAREIQEAKASNVTYDFVLEVDEHARAISVGIIDETAKTFGLRRVALPQRRK
jgi:VWFA-related protein